MRSRKYVSFLIVIIALSLLSQPTVLASDVPSWVHNPEKSFPSETYLTSVGSAPSLAAAKEKSKTGLSQIFSQRIDAVEELNQRVEETTEEGRTTFVEEVRQRTRVSVKTSAELIGVRIEKTGEVFQDGQRTYYALAVLNKDQAASLYRDRYRKNRRHLRETYAQARSIQDPVRQLRLLAQARNYGEMARRFQNQYAVLTSLGADPSTGDDAIPEETIRQNARDFARRMEQNLQSDTEESSMNSGSYRTPSVPEIERQLDELMSELTLVIAPPTLKNLFAESDYGEQFRNLVEEEFTRLGFQSQSEAEDSEITVSTRLSAQRTTKGRQGDPAFRWTVSLQMVSSKSDKTVGSITKSGVTVGLDETMVRTRTRENITDWIQTNLKDLIVEKLLST